MLQKAVLSLACLIILASSLGPNLPPACTTATNKLATTIITVPDNYSTIQEAINNAVEGDTILIANGTYNEHLVINKTIALIGAGKNQTILNGTITTTAIKITAENVIVEGFTIQNFKTGIIINQTRNTRIAQNRITKTSTKGAVYILHSNNITVSYNIIVNNSSPGVHMFKANTTRFVGNEISYNTGVGIYFENCTHFTATGNQVKFNLGDAICCTYGYNLQITENALAFSDYRGIWAVRSNGTAYRNSFIRNRENARSIFSNITWANGYLEGGNYWSNYTGVDTKRGSNQNETGSDGIGDTPHVIDADNSDVFPLMKPYRGVHDLRLAVNVCKTILPKGYNLKIIDATITNCGLQTETFNFTIQIHTTNYKQTITLTARNSTTLTFPWNTTDLPKGNYTIAAEAPPVSGETDTTDNSFTCTIKITIPGDYNGDGTVNQSDAEVVRQAWQYQKGETGYIADVDFNDDTIVNIKDAIIIGINWLES